MKITDNLENDIINAPQWFHDGIKDVPEDKIVENNLGDISYSKWASNNESQNLILFHSWNRGSQKMVGSYSSSV